jgi:hypothetical protein
MDKKIEGFLKRINSIDWRKSSDEVIEKTITNLEIAEKFSYFFETSLECRNLIRAMQRELVKRNRPMSVKNGEAA